MNYSSWEKATKIRPSLTLSHNLNSKKLFELYFFKNLKNKQFFDMLYLNEISFSLQNNIHISFLYDQESYHLISLIISAIYSYTLVYQYDYNKLKIHILLDNNTRDIVPEYNGDIQKYIQFSKAFNVCGITLPNKDLIFLTRKEDIIRLLFHELNHYTHNDRVNYNKRIKSIFDTEVSEVIPAEIYAEYISIVDSCYFISSIYQLNPDLLLEQEKDYNASLIAKHLKYYNYTSSNYIDFFTKNDRKNTQYTYIWEYVFYRGFMLVKSNLIEKIGKYMNTPTDYNISMSYNSRIYQKKN